MKMYYRNKGAIIFTLLIPVALMSIFGFLSRGGGGGMKIALTNYASGEVSNEFVTSLKNIGAFRVTEMAEADATTEIGKGNIDLQVVIPKEFGVLDSGKLTTGNVRTYFNKGKAQGGQVANMLIVQVISDLDRKLTHSPAKLTVETTGVAANNLNYFDFILPGILSMTIMQLGIFGVAFAFVSMKASGSLRRIQATPVHPVYFVFAQAVVRLLVMIATAAILLVLGTYFFNFHMVGSYLAFALVAIAGILIFLGFGFAIAGWAKDETQVAPVANLIQLPMLLLSGIFFSRDNFPAWLKGITDYFPLTYLSHGLRKIANEGASLAQIPTDLIGMTVWLVVIYAVAVRLFRWE
jgi:ABC-2 type transport system permease protein